MAKRPTVSEMMSVADKRLGKTTGASKGKKPAPKGSFKGSRPRVNAKDGLHGLKLKYTKKF